MSDKVDSDLLKGKRKVVFGSGLLTFLNQCYITFLTFDFLET